MAVTVSRRQWLVVAALIVAGSGASAALRLQPRGGQPLTLTPVVEAVLNDPGSPRFGAVRPDVTVVVFTDYQCPICKATDPALGRLLAADPTVAVVYKDWPIRGPLSEAAARTALAAAYQGRYPQVHAALMAVRGALSPTRIAEIAASAGCDPARLAADQTAHAREIDEQIARHRAQAFGLGLRGTPGYLVGPYLLNQGLDGGKLTKAVEKARRADAGAGW